MSRLIDADALMRAMYERAFETDGDTMWQSGCWIRYRAIEEVVKEQPTIEPSAQPDLQQTCNQLATDCISRKAALDGIADYLEEYDGIDENGNHDLKWCAMKEAELLIKDLPSAQPEVPDINVGDIISRQTAIDAVYKSSGTGTALKALKALPSAQPEPTLEQIEEYCHKRCLSIVDNALLHKYAQAEIIRCKDCNYACIDPERESDEIYCSENDFWKDDDFYCGYAERREDG